MNTPHESFESEKQPGPSNHVITALPDPTLKLDKPIAVECSYEEGMYVAKAPSLGLLEDGVGETEQEAVDDLAKTIQEQNEWLTAPETKVEDYAEVVANNLKKVISKTDAADEKAAVAE